jgi:SAM-dependent methyltransferase
MYFNRHFSLPTGYRYLLKDAIDCLEEINCYSNQKNNKLLDIGCGEQPYKKILQSWNYIGMDNYTESQAKPEIKGSILDIPLKDADFDACLSVWVLDDIFEVEKGIKETSRVLKNSGYYFAIESQATHIHNHPYDYFRFAPHALIEVCKKHNLELVQYKSFGGDFANIGFSLILVNRVFWGMLRLDNIMRPIYSLIINIVFRPLDKVFRLKIFKGRFEINSLGYFYVFKKVPRE